VPHKSMISKLCIIIAETKFVEILKLVSSPRIISHRLHHKKIWHLMNKHTLADTV
jgi:hypothetical protein